MAGDEIKKKCYKIVGTEVMIEAEIVLEWRGRGLMIVMWLRLRSETKAKWSWPGGNGGGGRSWGYVGVLKTAVKKRGETAFV